jgi:uncharacterized SAM-binding protein YcdF (DUF218 family)
MALRFEQRKLVMAVVCLTATILALALTIGGPLYYELRNEREKRLADQMVRARYSNRQGQ